MKESIKLIKNQAVLKALPTESKQQRNVTSRHGTGTKEPFFLPSVTTLKVNTFIFSKYVQTLNISNVCDTVRGISSKVD